MLRTPYDLPLLQAECLDRPATMPHGHQHGHIELNFLESGRFVLLRQGELMTIEAGVLILFWAAMPHHLVRLENARRFYYLHLALTEFRRWPLPVSFVALLLGGGLLVSAGEPKFHQQAVRQWVIDIQSAEADRRALALDEIQVRLRRLALEGSWKVWQGAGVGKRLQSRRVASEHHALDQVARMSAFLTQHSTEPLRLADIARAAGLHPAYAGALFKRVTGNSPMELLMQQRLAHAQRLLLTSDATVLAVGLDCGFSTPSRFYEAFARAHGTSPAAYRRRLLAAHG